MTMDVRAFINRQRWIEAVTYRDRAPHEYLLRKNVNGTDEEFMEFVHIIYRYGFKGEFWRHERVYFYLDGKFYWTMDKPIEVTGLINRCDASDYSVYMTFGKKSER